MVIQLEEWDDWRIAGTDMDWQIQKLTKEKGEDKWRASNYFSSLPNALRFAYEKSLKESPKVARSIKETAAECERAKDAICAAVAGLGQ